MSMYLLPSGVTGILIIYRRQQYRAEHQSVPSAIYHGDVSVDPCIERKSHTLWSSESHPPSYLANSRPTEVVERYADLLSELPAGQNETGQRVASAIDAAQPFVRRRNHTAYVLTQHQTNERQDTAPKISGL